jgi:hypothetical protein
MLSLNWLCILNSKPECEFEFKIKIQMEGKLKMEKNKKIKKKKGGNGCHAWTESPSPRPTSSLLLGAGPSNRCRCCVDPVCKSPAHVSDVLSLGGPPAIHTVGWESSIWFTGRPSPPPLPFIVDLPWWSYPSEAPARISQFRSTTSQLWFIWGYKQGCQPHNPRFARSLPFLASLVRRFPWSPWCRSESRRYPRLSLLALG